jgi:hypothetical protein
MPYLCLTYALLMLYLCFTYALLTLYLPIALVMTFDLSVSRGIVHVEHIIAVTIPVWIYVYIYINLSNIYIYIHIYIYTYKLMCASLCETSFRGGFSRCSTVSYPVQEFWSSSHQRISKMVYLCTHILYQTLSLARNCELWGFRCCTLLVL